MKKVLFLQNEGNVLGGVWFVNKTIATKLIDDGYEINIVSIRSGKDKLDYDKKINYKIVNNKKSWTFLHLNDVKKNPFNIFKLFVQKLELKIDLLKCKRYIKKANPDYIVATHYQVLDAIPKEKLQKSFYEHHASFKTVFLDRNNKKILKKYNNKISFIWLSKATMKKAQSFGLNNNYYIYNPSRIYSNVSASVLKSKRLVCVSRITKSVKRIDLLVSIMEEIFKDKALSDWKCFIYGDGIDRAELEKNIKNKNQIIFSGLTNDSKKAFMNSSININTSDSEGFSMSILEATSCGVPTVSFDFGESSFEQIQNNITGFIIKNDNKKEFINKLTRLMKEEKILFDMSKETYKYSKNFNIDNIIKNWENLLK